MKMITGTKTKYGYKMQSPNFPYDSTLYMGYSEKEMKKKYRKDHGLEGKHLEWIIL